MGNRQSDINESDFIYRELTRADIPQIKEISNQIWEGDDYVGNVIDYWFQSTSSVLYGLEINCDTPVDDNKFTKKLIGFSRINWIDEYKAWIEGGRIRVEYQKLGIGKKLLKSILNYIISRNAKIIQYDTWSTRDFQDDDTKEQNNGSIKLAKYYGFQKKDYVDFLFVNSSDLKKFDLESDLEYRQINQSDVYNEYLLKLNFNRTEINHGWSYLPFNKEIFNKLEEGNYWFSSENAIINVIDNFSKYEMEAPEKNALWFVCYSNEGNQEELYQLMFKLLKVNFPLSNYDELCIFCEPNVSNKLLEFGFEYIGREPSGVVLFEKIIDVNEKINN